MNTLLCKLTLENNLCIFHIVQVIIIFVEHFQINDKDSPDIDAGDVDQLASKQHSQLKVLPKDQQNNGLTDDTQSPKLQQPDAMQSQTNKIITNDVYYPEASFVNASDSQVNTEEHELETRLK